MWWRCARRIWHLATDHLGAIRCGVPKLRLRARQPRPPGRRQGRGSEREPKGMGFAQFGAALFRGITSGVYPTSPAAEIEYLLTLSDAPFIVCEDQEQFDKVLSIRERLPKLRNIIVIDPRGLRHYDRTSFLTFEEVTEFGKRLQQEKPQLLAESLAQQRMDDVGLIVFTSGSTGRPKAAMMTWRGLGAAARGLNSILRCGPRDLLVSYLPLCHVAEQMFSIHVPLATGAVVNFAESLRTVQEDLRELAPSVFFGVPRSGRNSTPAFRSSCVKPAACGCGCTSGPWLGDAADRRAALRLEPRAANALVVLVFHHAALAAQFRRLAKVPYRLLVRCSDRAGHAALLPRHRPADPRGVWPDRGVGRDDHAGSDAGLSAPSACPILASS